MTVRIVPSVFPVCILAAPLVFSAVIFSNPTFQVFDLGRLPSHDSSGATAINQREEITGTSWSEMGENVGFFWPNELGLIRIEPLEQSAFSTANDLNDWTMIVGTARQPGRAWAWWNGKTYRLANKTSGAQAVNNWGQIVGYTIESVHARATRWWLGRAVELGTLGAEPSFAWDINIRGTVVGHSRTVSGQTHPFWWRQGRMNDLGNLPGYEDCRAEAINDHEVVVGNCFSAGTWAPFRCEKGILSPLPTTAPIGNMVRSINDHGYAVGTDLPYRALIWTPEGKVLELNDFIPANSGWSLEDATDINNNGEIVGTGFNKGHYSAFLLRPIHGSIQKILATGK